MENTQNNMASYPSGDNKKTVLITVIVGAVVLGALVWWIKQVPQQAQTSPTPDAETAAINQDINSIDVGDLNSEFNSIDQELQGL